MNCKTLDFWPDEHLPVPPRSQLFSLPMIGVGTPGQEALSSYLVRLANLHSVNPNVLVSRVLFPLTTIERNSVAGNFSSIYAKTMNGIGKYAMEFSTALAQLTCRSELAFGTCLPWRDVLDSKAVGLLSPHPRCAPYAMRSGGLGIWSLTCRYRGLSSRSRTARFIKNCWLIAARTATIISRSFPSTNTWIIVPIASFPCPWSRRIPSPSPTCILPASVGSFRLASWR